MSRGVTMAVPNLSLTATEPGGRTLVDGAYTATTESPLSAESDRERDMASVWTTESPLRL
jgi:hypothetical protein